MKIIIYVMKIVIKYKLKRALQYNICFDKRLNICYIFKMVSLMLQIEYNLI